MFLLALLVPSSPLSRAAAQTPPAARRAVLQIVSWGAADTPGWLTLNEAFRRQIASSYSTPVDFYTEYLDVARFSGENYEARLVELLREKNAGTIDLVTAIGAPALAFALRHRELWPGASLVFSLVEPRDLERLRPGPDVTGVTVPIDPGGSLDAALAVQPEITRVFVVAGTFQLDSIRVAQARREFEAHRGRVEFTYLTDLPMAELVTRVRRLPAESIVLVLHVFRDGAGQVFRPYDSFKLIAQASNVPVYGILHVYLGAGMVGGNVASFRAQGEMAGEIAGRALAGKPPRDMPVRAGTIERVYDWRELRRWGLDGRAVPTTAAVYFREQGAWERYGRYITVAVAICLIQTALIARLLAQGSARRQAQRSLQERVQFLRLIVELSSSSRHLSAADVDRWIDEWLRRLGGFLGVDRAAVGEDEQGTLRFTHTWSTEPVAATTATSAEELPWSTGALRRGEIVQVSRLGELPEEAAMDRETWQRHGVKSYLATPLVEHRVTIGILSLASHQTERTWPDELVTRLRLIGDIFASAFVMKRAETAKDASEQLSRTILGVLSGPTAVIDRQSNILRINGAWGHLAGEPGVAALPWAPVGSNYLDACRRAAAEGTPVSSEALDGIGGVLAGDRPEFRLRYHFSPANGRRSMELLVVPLSRPEGGALISHIDLTDGEHAEVEIQELRQTVAHFGRVASLGDLSASLAHELNQPLTAILSNVQAARRFLSAGSHNLGEVGEILTDIEEDDRRAGEVIRRLRMMARKGATERQLFHLHDQVHEVARLIAPDVQIRQVAVRLQLAPSLPPIWGDRIQLSQVILNLMLNAADAMDQIEPAEREVLLRTWQYDNESVALSVRDRGTGIKANPVDQIFEPFFTSKREGMGLGLSISRSILEAHGGRLWASNNSDRGATLQLVLPISGEAVR